MLGSNQKEIKYDKLHYLYEKITAKREETSNILYKLIAFMESREVILNKFTDFRKVIETQVKIVIGSIHGIEAELIKLEKNVLMGPVDFTNINNKTISANGNITDLIAYLTNLNRNLQNVFLGSLFNYQVEDRKPEDDSFRVLKVK